MNSKSSPAAIRARTLLFVAFAIVYVVWGSTYLAIRVAVETLPPFLMAGARFLLAGMALLIWLRLRRVAFPTPNQWRHSAIVGILLLACGNGLVVWAEQSVTSGLAALLVALTPVWFAVLEWLRPGGNRPTAQTILGIAIGFGGVALLVAGHNAVVPGGPVNYWGLIALVLAGCSWAAGSLWSRYHPHASSPWMTAAAQMICGGAALLLLSLLAGEPGHFRPDRVSGKSWLAFAYLVVFGSWIAFSAYIYMLKASTPARIATYAYVNPVIAVVLGSVFLGESLSRQSLCAAGIILAGVVVTTLPRKS